MRINHVTILVKDKNVSRKFYTEILGFESKEIGGRLWIKIGEQYLHITENSGVPVPNTFYHFAIEIDNLTDYKINLKNKGINIFDFSDDNLQNFLRDTDGNLIELIDVNDDFFK
ncbi:MAG: VOC family protein [Patescibacteria group bacterium]